jgi:DNA repair exonuclease SbcCD ATPase subunit
MVEKINDLVMQFFARRTELDKTVFDPFFVDIGFAQGELLNMLTLLLEHLEHDRAKEGALNEKERELLDVIAKDRELVEQLHRDTQSITLLEHATNELMDRVMEQKTRVSRHEREAWQYMREVARILSDTKARELYYKVDAAWRNIKSIHRYFEQDLQRYLDQLITNAKQQVERIKSALQTLKEKGIDLKNSVERLEMQQEAIAAEPKEEALHKVTKVKSGGIFSTMATMLSTVSSWFVRAVLQLPRSIWRLIKNRF